MNTFDNAWAAFSRAMDETIELYERSGDPVVLANLVRHLGELIDIMEAEIVQPTNPIPPNAREIVDRLRNRLDAFKVGVEPPKR